MADKLNSLRSEAKSKIKTARELPVFSDAQRQAFNSIYVDSLDEALAVLDEDNIAAIGRPESVKDIKL